MVLSLRKVFLVLQKNSIKQTKPVKYIITYRLFQNPTFVLAMYLFPLFSLNKTTVLISVLYSFRLLVCVFLSTLLFWLINHLFFNRKFYHLLLVSFIFIHVYNKFYYYIGTRFSFVNEGHIMKAQII